MVDQISTKSWDGLRSVVEQRIKRSMSYGDTTAEQRQQHRQVLVRALCEMMRREDNVSRYLSGLDRDRVSESTVVWLLNGKTHAPEASRTTHDARRILDSVVTHA